MYEITTQKALRLSGMCVLIGIAVLATLWRPEWADIIRVYSVTADAPVDGAPAAAVPVLLYHGILSTGDRYVISPERFEEHMRALQKAGYRTVSVRELDSFLRQGEAIPDRSFMLTFDDGRRDSYQGADRILRLLRYRAVMFVITRFSLQEKSGYYLTRDDLKRMEKTGRWEIESHGRDDHVHYAIDSSGTEGVFLSNRLWREHDHRLETEEEYAERIRTDLEESKRELEALLGKRVTGYAFPFGDYGQQSRNYPESKEVIASIGGGIYPLLFRQRHVTREFSLNYPRIDVSFVRRIEVDPRLTGTELVEMLEAGRAKQLPLRGEDTAPRDWIINWGGMVYDKGIITLGSKGATNGSAVFLDGSRLWRDYELRARVRIEKGQSVSLVARLADEANYLSCAVSGQAVRIEQIIGGVSKVLAQTDGIPQFQERAHQLTMRVEGTGVSCAEGDRVLVSSDAVDEKLESGGIGFKSWNPTPGNSMVVASGIEVSPL